MNANLLTLISEFAFGAPFLAIAAVFIHYYVRRAAWSRKKRKGLRNPGYCPSSSALGMILLFAQMFYRPSVSYVLEARQRRTRTRTKTTRAIQRASENNLIASSSEFAGANKLGILYCGCEPSSESTASSHFKGSDERLPSPPAIYTRKRRNLCFSIGF